MSNLKKFIENIRKNIRCINVEEDKFVIQRHDFMRLLIALEIMEKALEKVKGNPQQHHLNEAHLIVRVALIEVDKLFEEKS